MPLLRLRATYMVQLLVTLSQSTATSLSTLFTNLRSQETLKTLAEMDACVIGTMDVFCEVWTSALTELNVQSKVDIAAILRKHEVKARTSGAKSMLGQTPGAGAEKDKSDDDIPTVFQVNHLIKYTLNLDVLPADSHLALMLEVQKQLLCIARPLGLRVTMLLES